MCVVERARCTNLTPQDLDSDNEGAAVAAGADVQSADGAGTHLGGLDGGGSAGAADAAAVSGCCELATHVSGGAAVSAPRVRISGDAIPAEVSVPRPMPRWLGVATEYRCRQQAAGQRLSRCTAVTSNGQPPMRRPMSQRRALMAAAQVLLLVLSGLRDTADCVRAAAVCRHWMSVVALSNELWFEMQARDWGLGGAGSRSSGSAGGHSAAPVAGGGGGSTSGGGGGGVCGGGGGGGAPGGTWHRAPYAGRPLLLPPPGAGHMRSLMLQYKTTCALTQVRGCGRAVVPCACLCTGWVALDGRRWRLVHRIPCLACVRCELGGFLQNCVYLCRTLIAHVCVALPCRCRRRPACSHPLCPPCDTHSHKHCPSPPQVAVRFMVLRKGFEYLVEVRAGRRCAG